MQLPTDESIARAISRALAGDPSGYAELYRTHVAILIRQCSAFAALDADDVDDVVQETFVRAFKHLSRLKSVATFRPWLLSIARNRCITVAKSRASIEQKFAQLGLEEETVGLIPTSVEREAEAEVVRAVIDELPTGAERETASLFYVGGISARQISTQHGVGKSAVTMRLDRFRTRIKRRLVRRFHETDVTSP